MGEILPPEFGVLFVGKVKSDLAGLALNHRVENLPVLGHLYPTGALGELDQGFIAVKSGSARQRRTLDQCRRRSRPRHSSTGRTSGPCDVEVAGRRAA